MTKPKFITKATTRTSARKGTKATGPASASTTKSRRQPASRSTKAVTPKTPSNTKHARILALLRLPAGTTVAAIMTATEWQQHSVRGFLAGVVRKKLGLNLIAERTDKGRVYRIKDAKTALVAADRIKQAA